MSYEVNYFWLHRFLDASKKAYSMTVHLRAVLKNKNIVTNFEATKIRGTPLKIVFIPLLEYLEDF